MILTYFNFITRQLLWEQINIFLELENLQIFQVFVTIWKKTIFCNRFFERWIRESYFEGRLHFVIFIIVKEASFLFVHSMSYIF